jgi:hypothetical protein
MFPALKRAALIVMAVALILTDDKGIIHHIRQTGAPEAIHLDTFRKLDVTYNTPRHHKKVAKRL